jgi:hypothetical protein
MLSRLIRTLGRNLPAVRSSFAECTVDKASGCLSLVS